MSAEENEELVERAPKGRPRGPRGPMGPSMSGEKAHDFKGTMGNLFHALGGY